MNYGNVHVHIFPSNHVIVICMAHEQAGSPSSTGLHVYIRDRESSFSHVFGSKLIGAFNSISFVMKFTKWKIGQGQQHMICGPNNYELISIYTCERTKETEFGHPSLNTFV